MTDFFVTVLNMSLTGSLVILAVLAARWLLRKGPKIFSYALWAVVLFRLLCPVSLASPLSALTLVQPTTMDGPGPRHIPGIHRHPGPGSTHPVGPGKGRKQPRPNHGQS